jgi:hypothetical protein
VSRPIYESDEDRANEIDVIERICGNRGLTYKKLPMRDFVDFGVMKNGKLVSLVEVRHRNIPSDKYPTVICNLAKVVHARHYERETGVPAYFFVQWTDRLAYVSFSEDFTVAFGGRGDNNYRDWQEQGLVAHFSVDKFKGV